MMKSIKVILFCSIVLSSFYLSCSYNNNQLGVVGKKLVCDSLLLFKEGEYYLVNDTIFKDVSVLLWIDSTKCSQCELEHLGNYDSFSSHCERILGKPGRIKVVIALSEQYGIGYLINDVKYLNHSFDVMIDYKNYLTSLFDCNDRMLLVLKDGCVLNYYRMENTQSDAYKMSECLDYLKQMYDQEQYKFHDKKH